MNESRYACEPKLDFPLHLAGRKKDNEMVKLFIEAGAAVDAKNVRKLPLVNHSELGQNHRIRRPLDIIMKILICHMLSEN